MRDNEGNDGKKIREMIRRGEITPSAALPALNVAHDGWCSFLHTHGATPCDCNPEITPAHNPIDPDALINEILIVK